MTIELKHKVCPSNLLRNFYIICELDRFFNKINKPNNIKFLFTGERNEV